ncbi:hypothetical protein AMK59_4569 [Oryctes borbonicus]|uniref:Uncharacterized protein n=1 Tax=Oryctes borbonicus TaxID=1629725 RepID=A0A0T6B6L1_9SCAR|nr:hypothetical protein AMK59_4569 [Oryctes borbonicus]
MIDKIHPMVLNDRRIKVREIPEATGISQGIASSILHEKLGVEKISVKWVPRLPSMKNKRNRVVDSEAVSTLFCRNPEFFHRYITMNETLPSIENKRKAVLTLFCRKPEFFHRYITMNETWIHYYTLETKEQSKQQGFEGECAPKKVKTEKSTGKAVF